MSAFLATRPRQSNVLCMDCMCPLVLARQLEGVGGGACSPASERQQENVLTVAHLWVSVMQQWVSALPVHMQILGWMWILGECHDRACWTAPAREWGSDATVGALQLQ